MHDKIKIKGAIFDIDGTLLDSMPIWQDACARYLRSIGVMPEPGLSETVFSMTLNEGVLYTKNHYQLENTYEEIEKGILGQIEDFYYNEAKLKPGVYEFVMALYNKGIPMVLATTGDENLASYALDKNKILKCFDGLLTCNALNTSKKELLIFDRCKSIIEEKYGEKLSERDIAVFEDSITAIKTTRAAGYRIVGIADDAGKESWNEIEAASDVFIKSLDELDAEDICIQR